MTGGKNDVGSLMIVFHLYADKGLAPLRQGMLRKMDELAATENIKIYIFLSCLKEITNNNSGIVIVPVGVAKFLLA